LYCFINIIIITFNARCHADAKDYYAPVDAAIAMLLHYFAMLLIAMLMLIIFIDALIFYHFHLSSSIWYGYILAWPAQYILK